MYYKEYPKKNQERYKELLNIIGSLSNLFSESEIPYLYYRSAENIYCSAFDADNLARSDVSVDAVKNNIGIGLKTFLIGNRKTFQKVAEFNASRPQYIELSEKNKVIKISELRNERINFTKRLYNLDKLFYHCVVRGEGKLYIFEDSFELIDTSNIKISRTSNSSIHFTDGKSEYSFNLSKSTLLKKFYTDSFDDEVEVEIIKDVFELLEKLVNSFKEADKTGNEKQIILPLYSPSGRGFEGSGLNQWNAKGRENKKTGKITPRDINEIYISIPLWIHRDIPGFFPPRDTEFKLLLPNGDELSAKVCQDGGKALMSNPNNALGKWLLRDVLNIQEGKLVTLELLNGIGIDSVSINKINNNTFKINFKETGSYNTFLEQYKIS